MFIFFIPSTCMRAHRYTHVYTYSFFFLDTTPALAFLSTFYPPTYQIG